MRGKDTFSFVGGQIEHNLKEWRKVSSDPWLLQTVSGAVLPLEEWPTQLKEPRPYNLGLEEMDIVTQEVNKLWTKGVVEQVHPSRGQVISNLFLRPKKDGGHRLILDLTWLNTHVEYQHFKMTSIATALEMMRPDCWMGSIDLKDAYYSVPVAQEFRKLLRFIWQDRLYQFKVLPNGLACAPRIFTKLLAPVFAKLREEGVETFPYIDDSFLVADSYEECARGLRKLRDLLESLGFVIHQEKSIVYPTRDLVFLGFRLVSDLFKVFLTEDKELKLERTLRDILLNSDPTIREVAGLVGLLISYQHAFVYGGTHTKQLEREKVEALRKARGDFDQTMTLSKEASWELGWWLTNFRQSGAPVRRQKPQVTLFCDASNEGWGAHLQGCAIGGRWSQEELQEHINVLELRAILLALRSLCEELEGKHIRIMTDNTTALAYVKHQGGVRSEQCDKVAREIWRWAEYRNIWLSIAHIPGVENTLADFKSRHFADNLEWGLSDKLFEKVRKVFGDFDIDLFATRLNCKVPNYVSWAPDPHACAIDAFTIDWSDSKFYAFPPFRQVGRVIEKAVEDKATGVLVVPWWPTQTWWGRLTSLHLRHLKFRGKKNNLIPSGNPDSVEFISRSPLGAFLFWHHH